MMINCRILVGVFCPCIPVQSLLGCIGYFRLCGSWLRIQCTKEPILLFIGFLRLYGLLYAATTCTCCSMFPGPACCAPRGGDPSALRTASTYRAPVDFLFTSTVVYRCMLYAFHAQNAISRRTSRLRPGRHHPPAWQVLRPGSRSCAAVAMACLGFSETHSVRCDSRALCSVLGFGHDKDAVSRLFYLKPVLLRLAKQPCSQPERKNVV